MEQESVAAKLSNLRKLAGLTQQQFAARAFVSTSLVKKIEQERTPPSSAFLAAAAQALGVMPEELTGNPPWERIVCQKGEQPSIAALREALQAFDDPHPKHPLWTVAETRAVAARAEHDRRTMKYDRLLARLPQLLHHLFVLVEHTVDGTEQGDQARALLHDAYRLTATASGRFGQTDIAAVASERHLTLAPKTGDPLRLALSDFHRSSHHLQYGNFAAGLRIVQQAQRSTEGTSPKCRAMRIQLHLRAAVLAARGGDRSGADDHIRCAREISRRWHAVAEPFPNTDASELNIDIHWCAIPVEGYEGTESVNRAQKVRIIDPSRPERVGHHHIDQARAWLLHGDRDKALGELSKARTISPRETKRHPSVRATVHALAAHDRRVTESLAGFARWAGISLRA